MDRISEVRIIEKIKYVYKFSIYEIKKVFTNLKKDVKFQFINNENNN